MSRDDLVTTNERIVGSVTEEALGHSPHTIVIVLSNPLDAMCHVAKAASGLPKERVFGQAGILDTARFGRSSRGRPARPSATCTRSFSEDTEIRWCRWFRRRRSVACR